MFHLNASSTPKAEAHTAKECKPLDRACQFVTPELYDSIMTVLIDAKDNMSDYKAGLAVVANLDKLANSCGVDLVTLFLSNELGGDFCDAYNARLVATLQAKLPRSYAPLRLR